MAHLVTFNINSKVALSKDVVFEISEDGKKLGELLISKGNIEWKPKNKAISRHRLGWKEFAKVMIAEGKLVRVAPQKRKPRKSKV